MVLPDIAVDELAARFGQSIANLARDQFSRMLTQIRAGVAPLEAIQSSQAGFTGEFADQLAAAFSELLQRAIGVAEVRAMPVGGISLSQRLYANTRETNAQTLALVREHAQGLQQARRLALQLYDGYDPSRGAQRPLEGRARADLPKALRAVTQDPTTRRELSGLIQQGQAQAARLKSPALRAAYLQTFKAWEEGAGQEALKRRLEIAWKEKNRYFATRIAHTEMARAHQVAKAAELMADDTIDVVQVVLNPRHPLRDICDMHGRADLWGLGPGCYPKARAPRPPFHPHCWCKLRSRPDLSATGAKEVPRGEAAYLRSLGNMSQAGQVMGSRARAQKLLDGAAFDDVVNREGVDPMYRLHRLGDPDALRHPLGGAPTNGRPKAAGVQFVERAVANRREKQPPMVLSAIAPRAIERAKAVGVDLTGKAVALDHDGVLHIVDQHGSSSEKLRGQAPIDAGDLASFDRLFNAAALSAGDPPKAKDGALLLAGSVALDGWDYTLVAKVRRRHVVPYTLFKRPQK